MSPTETAYGLGANDVAAKFWALAERRLDGAEPFDSIKTIVVRGLTPSNVTLLSLVAWLVLGG